MACPNKVWLGSEENFVRKNTVVKFPAPNGPVHMIGKL